MNKTLIIAEAGVNHNGEIGMAKELIDIASEAKADIVKFQTAIPELVVSSNAGKAEYQKRQTGEGSQLDMIRKIHFELDVYKELRDYCIKRKIRFLSSPFDHISIDFLNDLGMDIFKIPSGEITNKPYLEHIARIGKSVILSTGMSEIFEIERAIKVLENGGVSKRDLTILHCNTEYPTPLEDVNLNAMATLAEKFGINVGYSDHTLGIEVPIAAVAMGATVIEKHFTLDKSLEGPDHMASLSPLELSLMVKGIRNIEKALGSSEKKTTMSEMKNRDIARRSIHVKNDLKQGTVISSTDLVMKRPGNGISPFEADKIIGKILARDVIEDEILKLTDLV